MFVVTVNQSVRPVHMSFWKQQLAIKALYVIKNTLFFTSQRKFVRMSFFVISCFQITFGILIKIFISGKSPYLSQSTR